MITITNDRFVLFNKSPKRFSLLNSIKWAGTILDIIGALCVAFGIFFTGYILFLIGASLWVIAGTMARDKPLTLLHFVFACINIVGLVNLGGLTIGNIITVSAYAVGFISLAIFVHYTVYGGQNSRQVFYR